MGCDLHIYTSRNQVELEDAFSYLKNEVIIKIMKIDLDDLELDGKDEMLPEISSHPLGHKGVPSKFKSCVYFRNSWFADKPGAIYFKSLLTFAKDGRVFDGFVEDMPINEFIAENCSDDIEVIELDQFNEKKIETYQESIFNENITEDQVEENIKKYLDYYMIKYSDFEITRDKTFNVISIEFTEKILDRKHKELQNLSCAINSLESKLAIKYICNYVCEYSEDYDSY